MASTEMNKENYCFGGDFEIFSLSMIFKMQIIVLKNDSKGLILITDTDYSFLEFEILQQEAPILPLVPPFLSLSNKSILHKYVQPLYALGS